jgi:alkaline phosphatase D
MSIIPRFLGSLMAAAALIPAAAFAQGPYLATGFKIGEVTESQAIIWARLTRHPERVGSGAPVPMFQYLAPGVTGLVEAPPGRFRPPDFVPVVTYPEGATIDTIEGAVPGSNGEVRVLYRATADSAWLATPWRAVASERDFTAQLQLSGLTATTAYAIRIEARAEGTQTVSAMLDGRLRTAPAPDSPARVVFAATTGQMYRDQDAPGGGFRMYPSILALQPSFFVHTGDIVYYDLWAKSADLARWGWARMYSLPTNYEFQRRVPTYFMKDDHDTWQDDAWPTQQSQFMGEFSFDDGVSLFREQVPMGERTYRTYRWGKDVQIWLVEGRDFRDANPDPDGPDKSIWGDEQKTWFKETVAASDATFRILISPTPLIGPDAPDKLDSHANTAFATEGRELREFMARQGNMIVICGDRHWQYISVDPATGLREYATGAASDAHAGGWDPNDVRPEHRYLNVVGGFLSVTAERVDGIPRLALRHHSVDGEVLNEEILLAD